MGASANSVADFSKSEFDGEGFLPSSGGGHTLRFCEPGIILAWRSGVCDGGHRADVMKGSRRGIKFLGDTAAHNPMVNVDVADILPQMPFIVTAYKELALHL